MAPRAETPSLAGGRLATRPRVFAELPVGWAVWLVEVWPAEEWLVEVWLVEVWLVEVWLVAVWLV